MIFDFDGTPTIGNLTNILKTDKPTSYDTIRKHTRNWIGRKRIFVKSLGWDF